MSVVKELKTKRRSTKLLSRTHFKKALTGHAYSRAIRGNILIQNALANIIFSLIDLSDEEVLVLNNLFNLVGKSEFHTLLKNDEFKEIKNKFLNKLESIKENGPTARLWILYFNMVDLAKQFIQAEKSGNWSMHLQDMNNLENIMDVMEYDKFSRSGYFTIRRIETF